MRLIFEWRSRRKILRTIEKLFLDSSLVAGRGMAQLGRRRTERRLRGTEIHLRFCSWAAIDIAFWDNLWYAYYYSI